MKDFLLELVSKVSDKQAKINVMREYLQLYALRAMYEKKYDLNLGFVGGTALRLAYGLPRFSEDLDFSLLVKKENYLFTDILNAIKQSFTDAAYTIVVRYSEERVVHSAFLKFPELMHSAGLTHKREQNLSIKFEIDTNPPRGAHLTETIVNKYFPIALRHYDLGSLLAGKIHALLTRPYQKGRDYFDIGWILSRWKIEPNLEFLNAALKQTGGKYKPDKSNWKKIILDKMRKADWHAVSSDMSKFVEDQGSVSTMDLEYFVTLLDK